MGSVHIHSRKLNETAQQKAFQPHHKLFSLIINWSSDKWFGAHWRLGAGWGHDAGATPQTTADLLSEIRKNDILPKAPCSSHLPHQIIKKIVMTSHKWGAADCRRSAFINLKCGIRGHNYPPPLIKHLWAKLLWKCISSLITGVKLLPQMGVFQPPKKYDYQIKCQPGCCIFNSQSCLLIPPHYLPDLSPPKTETNQHSDYFVTYLFLSLVPPPLHFFSSSCLSS